MKQIDTHHAGGAVGVAEHLGEAHVAAALAHVVLEVLPGGGGGQAGNEHAELGAARDPTPATTATAPASAPAAAAAPTATVTVPVTAASAVVPATDVCTFKSGYKKIFFVISGRYMSPGDTIHRRGSYVNSQQGGKQAYPRYHLFH